MPPGTARNYAAKFALKKIFAFISPKLYILWRMKEYNSLILFVFRPPCFYAPTIFRHSCADCDKRLVANGAWRAQCADDSAGRAIGVFGNRAGIIGVGDIYRIFGEQCGVASSFAAGVVYSYFRGLRGGVRIVGFADADCSVRRNVDGIARFVWRIFLRDGRDLRCVAEYERHSRKPQQNAGNVYDRELHFVRRGAVYFDYRRKGSGACVYCIGDIFGDMSCADLSYAVAGAAAAGSRCGGNALAGCVRGCAGVVFGSVFVRRIYGRDIFIRELYGGAGIGTGAAGDIGGGVFRSRFCDANSDWLAV